VYTLGSLVMGEETSTPFPEDQTCSNQDTPPSPHTVPSRQEGTEAPAGITRATPQDLRRPRSPSSLSLDFPFEQLASTASDRVFPIRSVVSVDPTPAPTPGSRREGPSSDGFPSIVLPSSSSAGVSVIGSRFSSRRHSINSTGSADRMPDLATHETPSKPQRETANSVSGGAGRRPVGPGRQISSSNTEERQRMSGSRQMQASVFNSSSMSGTGSIPSVSGSVGGSSVADLNRGIPEDGGGLLTARFKHIITEGDHAVITGRDGDTLQRCEDEPIHIPGAVQGFGLLVALQEDDKGKLKVRVVSENSNRIIGYTPRQLFDLDSFCDILSEEQTDNLIDHIDFVREEDADPSTNGPEVFTLAIRSQSRRRHKLWCAMHTNEANRDLIICEFELEDDRINPLMPPGETTTEPPEDTLHSNPSAEEYAESTVNNSKPLRVLRGARKRKGEAAAMEVFNIMSQVQEQIASAPTLEMFLKILVGVVKELTGFHRVMIYQFDQSWNGRVVTELVDPRATKDLYKGLNFPASDIPKQARDLYKVNKVRLLYDRDQETARLVCRTLKDLETPLDLTYAYLRAMSPIHIKYLRNMAVRASMSISINAFDELWGLIACHSYGSKGMRVSFPIRKMCRLVGDSASRNIERLSYASRLQARKLINTVPTESNPSGYIVASSDDLLKLFDADYGLLSIRDETKKMGMLEQTQEALAMLEYLRLRKITSVTSSTDIRLDFPDLRYAPGFTIIAGFLLVPLSISGSDFIVFFRKGQTREVRWAGNPYEKYLKEGSEGYLEPRKSFKTWSETVVGKCREWTEEQIETAAVLCLVYGKFIEVWRQKEAALQSSQFTRLLLANSAHEVRTPLNAIINYLEIALEGAIDQETRENLSKSHSASKSLIYVINDLLDLTKTEEGHNLIKDEVFDLPSTVREATDSFTGDARRKHVDYGMVENPGVPQFVVGDQRRVRQALSNVIANAIQHTTTGAVKVELWLANRSEVHVEIDIVVQDTGVGMSPQKLDRLFNELEQVQLESDEGLEQNLAPESRIVKKGERDKQTLGLGLALVARIVCNMNGQLRFKSEEWKGSRFVIQLGFDLPADDQGTTVLAGAAEANIGPPTNQPVTPPVEVGEVTPVNKSAQRRSQDVSKGSMRRKSNDSLNSMKTVNSPKSFKSGSSAKSDVDRLIVALQESTTGAKEHPTDLDVFSLPKGSRSERRTTSRRPSTLSRSHSLSDQTSMPETPGQKSITGSKTPMRPIRMPGDDSQGSPMSGFPPRTPARVLFDIPDKPKNNANLLTAEKLNVLVAEDDPINSRIVKKRLEKIGHAVSLTVNGEECASAYGGKAAFFDVVLMDIQVPTSKVSVVA